MDLLLHVPRLTSAGIIHPPPVPKLAGTKLLEALFVDDYNTYLTHHWQAHPAHTNTGSLQFTCTKTCSHNQPAVCLVKAP